MNFIFFWRLEYEKGFDLLIESLGDFEALPGNFFVFWDGSMRRNLFETLSRKSTFEDCSQYCADQIHALIKEITSGRPSYKIFFFSWQPKSLIDSFLRISHFSLMPSRFLETFGLSALESLSAGVPVIWFRKWGLVPFISENLTVEFASSDRENIAHISGKLREVSSKYGPEIASSLRSSQWRNWEALSEESKRVAARYSEERWMTEVRAFLPKDTKKILLVSDYVSLLGGIETHVASIASLLEKQGYEVTTFGWNLRKNRFTKVLRLFGLVISYHNFAYARELRKLLEREKPDVVWFHSVSRFLGPLVVRAGVHSGKFSCITYHDLGMWSPFPSKMEREEEVPTQWNLGSFLSVTKSFNIITHIAILFKYLQLSLLRTQIQKIDIHLVPSEFLRKYVREITGIDNEKIITLEHFQK